jgi:hypothetical protein
VPTAGVKTELEELEVRKGTTRKRVKFSLTFFLLIQESIYLLLTYHVIKKKK